MPPVSSSPLLHHTNNAVYALCLKQWPWTVAEPLQWRWTVAEPLQLQWMGFQLNTELVKIRTSTLRGSEPHFRKKPRRSLPSISASELTTS